MPWCHLLHFGANWLLKAKKKFTGIDLSCKGFGSPLVTVEIELNSYMACTIKPLKDIVRSKLLQIVLPGGTTGDHLQLEVALWSLR
jgi:hypothetical protein